MKSGKHLLHIPAHLFKGFERTGWRARRVLTTVSQVQLRETAKGMFREEVEIEKVLLMTLSSGRISPLRRQAGSEMYKAKRGEFPANKGWLVTGVQTVKCMVGLFCKLWWWGYAHWEYGGENFSVSKQGSVCLQPHHSDGGMEAGGRPVGCRSRWTFPGSFAGHGFLIQSCLLYTAQLQGELFTFVPCE